MQKMMGKGTEWKEYLLYETFYQGITAFSLLM
jgi:hypothetical protein